MSLSDIESHDGRSRGSKVNNENGHWLLLAMAEFKDPSQYEYLIHTSTPSVKSGLIRSRPGVAHRLESPEENDGEHLYSNVNEAYVAVVRTFFLVSLLVDRHKDAWAPVIRNGLFSPCLSSHLMEPGRQSVGTRLVDFNGYAVLSRCLIVAQPFYGISDFCFRRRVE
ncbi:unnamed protein product [Dibothriocephalus latus]|uniref:Uncharacterized protein n=1 Tax=Dibothriocephalus latus TaxID=60516 RepID=A0A3P7N7J1_DIBLA|nr:unnamed protein product [Dibothriocephalus latus]